MPRLRIFPHFLCLQVPEIFDAAVFLRNAPSCLRSMDNNEDLSRLFRRNTWEIGEDCPEEFAMFWRWCRLNSTAIVPRGTPDRLKTKRMVPVRRRAGSPIRTGRAIS